MQIKPIAVKPSNADRIDALCQEVEGPRVQSRLLRYTDLEEAVRDAEKRLKALPQRLWVGVTVEVDPHSVPNSYGSRAQGTTARLVRRSRDWALVEVARTDTRSKSYGQGFVNRITLSAEIDREALLAAMLRKPALTLPDPTPEPTTTD
ncbi:hypothetical protein [Kytococcus sedentarius]|uniref:hypothetical protein n=1 Tax=Kytococcus sedentarius TaxID=1276 RepID=UPI00384ED4D6